MNKGQNIAVIGENGSGKSGVVKASLELFGFSKNIWRRIFLLVLFICFVILSPLSEKLSKKFRNKIAARRGKVITINLWSLFGVKNKEDYPETNIENHDLNLSSEKMLTAGILPKSLSYDSDAPKNKKNFLSYQCEFDNEGKMVKNKITHLYIKKMIWGTIANSLQPRHKRVDLEKILKKERYEEGASRRKFLPKTILAIISCLVILIGAPLIMFYSLHDAGPEWAKIIGSVSVDAPISIIIISFKAWMNVSKQKRINDFLIDQSNNVFISKSLTFKSKFKLHTFHFEDIDRVHEWMGKERLDVIISMLENIKFIHYAENVNVVLETDLELWNSIISEKTNKQNGRIHDYHMKIVESVTRVESVTHESLSDLVFKKIKKDHPSYNNEESNFNNIQEHINSFIKKLMNVEDFKKMSSWRNMNHFIDDIVQFFKKYESFIAKDGFTQIENKEEILLDLFYRKHMPSEIMATSNYPELKSETHILLEKMRDAYDDEVHNIHRNLRAKKVSYNKLNEDIEAVKRDILLMGDNKREMYAVALFNNMKYVFEGFFLNKYLKYEYEYNQDNNNFKIYINKIKKIWKESLTAYIENHEEKGFLNTLMQVYNFTSDVMEVLERMKHEFNISELNQWLVKNQAAIIHILEIGGDIDGKNWTYFSNIFSEEILINYIYSQRIQERASIKRFAWTPREEIALRLKNILQEFDEKNFIYFNLRGGISKNLEMNISDYRNVILRKKKISNEIKRIIESRIETIKDIIKINDFIELRFRFNHRESKDTIFHDLYLEFKKYKNKFSNMLNPSLHYLSIEERMDEDAILKKVILVYSLKYPKDTWDVEFSEKSEKIKEGSIELFKDSLYRDAKTLIYVDKLKGKKGLNDIAENIRNYAKKII